MNSRGGSRNFGRGDTPPTMRTEGTKPGDGGPPPEKIKSECQISLFLACAIQDLIDSWTKIADFKSQSAEMAAPFKFAWQYRPVARIFFGGVRSLERKGYFCQRFSVAVKSIYNQLRHDNSLLL